ncbi:MAG: GNAT family N-acetyltransferase [Saprospiraceae bacterium]|nr:GNAT family N-acetyltransferase [Saprospiraceae bacterium]
MNTTTIRKATLADLPAVHELVRELAIYEESEAAFTATLEDYTRDFQAGRFEVLVAETESAGIIGMAFYYMTYSTWKGPMLWLEDFVVKAAHRGSGAGQLLFDAYVEEARQRGCRLVKWQVLDWNEPALNFYRRQQAIIETNWWSGKIFLTDSAQTNL